MKTKTFSRLSDDERTKIHLSVSLDFTLDAIKREFHTMMRAGACIEDLEEFVKTVENALPYESDPESVEE